MTNTSCCCYIL